MAGSGTAVPPEVLLLLLDELLLDELLLPPLLDELLLIGSLGVVFIACTGAATEAATIASASEPENKLNFCMMSAPLPCLCCRLFLRLGGDDISIGSAAGAICKGASQNETDVFAKG